MVIQIIKCHSQRILVYTQKIYHIRKLCIMSKVDRKDVTVTSTRDLVATCPPSDVVLVTGGAGFLGQHIVKMLQERADYVKEIRILDLKPFNKILEYTDNKPVTSIVGSITDWDLVEKTCFDVSSVFHVAGLVSYGTNPDIKGMEEINIQGTKNIIAGCIRGGVQRLIYCSTVDVAIGYDPIIDGNEENTPVPDKFLFPGYPETKYKAECLVLQTNGKNCAQGRKLQTLALRTNVLYGEGDPYYITSGLKSASKNSGVLIQVGNGQAKFQQTYVGNAAWAFVCADKTLCKNPSLGGELFYIPDNTPIKNSFEFMKPFLECRNFRLSSYRVSFYMAYGTLYLFELFLLLISPFFKYNYKNASCSVWYICSDLYFSGKKAKRILEYDAIITPEEAIARSLKYYKTAKLV